MPYSGCVPAKVTVPSAGARTDVRGCALMSMPPWNSVTRVHGERRLPNSELTEPRTGQRDGSAATALPAPGHHPVPGAPPPPPPPSLVPPPQAGASASRLERGDDPPYLHA